MTAIVLAGGLGTRLRNVIGKSQKVITEVHRRPFITFILDQLISAGLNHAVICTGYQGNELAVRLGNAYGPLTLYYSHEIEPLGTGGTLRHALPLIASDDALVMNGDSLCTVDLAAFYAYHKSTHAQASMLLTHVHDNRRYGSVYIDVHCRIRRFCEKDEDSGNSEWINAGIYLMQRDLIATIQGTSFISLEKDIFPRWTEKHFFAYPCNASFIDIGVPESLKKAEQFLKHIA